MAGDQMNQPIPIKSIHTTQRTLNRPNQLPGMIEAILRGDTLPRIELSMNHAVETIFTDRDTESTISVEDGHHRLAAYWLAGRQYLDPDEFFLYIEYNKFYRPNTGTIDKLIEKCKKDFPADMLMQCEQLQ